MTTVFLDQSAALDNRLNVMSDLPPVAWEGRPFEPTLDLLYLKPVNQPAETTPETERDLTRGTYEIEIFAPAGEGKNEAILMSDKIANHFKHGTEMSYNGVNVIVENVHRDEGSIPVNGINSVSNIAWYNVSVFIDYYSFTTRR